MATGRFPRLFITDLDGTALGGGYRPYSVLPPAFAALLRELAERGCRWATCTTWTAGDQLQLVQASSAAPPPAYAVIGSGVQIAELSADGERWLPVEPYSQQMAARAADAVERQLRPLLREAAMQFDCRQLSFNGYWLAMTVDGGETGRLLNWLESQASRCTDLHIEPVPVEHRFYAHPAALRKGDAVRELLRLTGLTPEDVVVAGDERMDLTMMEPDVAAHVLCPANAHDAVKRRVAERGGRVGVGLCSDGVIDAFRQLAADRGWM